MAYMRLSPLSYRSLFVLYGASAIVLLPFGGVYAYARTHGWDRNSALLVCLISGVAVALLVWSRLEPRLLASQPIKIDLNLNPAMPTASSWTPTLPITAIGAFVVAVNCSAPPATVNLGIGTVKVLLEDGVTGGGQAQAISQQVGVGTAARA
jgi:hypothetical protein